MAREASATDFFIEVEGIGTFSFARRKLRDELRIAAEYSRLTEGIEKPTQWLEYVATWISQLKILGVTAPDDWNIDEMDPLDQDTYTKLREVFMAMRKKEDSFRPAKAPSVEAERPGVGEGAGVLVSPEVQPGADGSTVS